MRAFIPIVAALCLASASTAGSARQAAQPRVYKPGDGVVAPVVVKEVKPQYSPETMRARVQGVVTLECVVQADGTVGDVKVTKSLHEGLDQEAIKALRQWRFKPGVKDGKAVPVRITAELTFSLRDTPGAGDAAKPPVFPVRPLTTEATGAKSQPEAAPVYQPGQGVTAPVLIKEVKPRYTVEAKDAKIQGTVLLECVVRPDGTIGDVEVTRPLDDGLDEEAIKAVRQWRFEPGKKDGRPVPVRITLEMTFTLR